MSVSSDLLCSFELLKPLDSSALKQQMKKSRHRRTSMMHQSPVSTVPLPPPPCVGAATDGHNQPAIMSAQSY